MKWLNLFDENMVFCYGGAMKRLVMIFILALWLPLGVGFATPEDYDGSQDPEAWFFDSILDENGNIILDEHTSSMGIAIGDINVKYFRCIKTEVKITRFPNYELDYFLNALTTGPLAKFESWENRYLTFQSCKHRSCSNRSFYFVDTVGKHIAVIAIYPVDIFSKERDVYGDLIYDFDNYYKFMFLLPDAPEEFVQKSLEFAKNIEVGTNRRPEIFVADCRK